MRQRLRSAGRRQSAGDVGRETATGRRHGGSTTATPRSAERGKPSEGCRTTTAAAADALQQQVDEYLASFDPDKPLYQDGWDMEEMQESFQHKLRSMRNLCCVVCSERWCTDGECLDPALYVREWTFLFQKQKQKEAGGLELTCRGL